MTSVRSHASCKPEEVTYPEDWPAASGKDEKEEEEKTDEKIAALITLEQMRSTAYILGEKGWKVGAFVEWTDKSVYEISAQAEGWFDAKLVGLNAKEKVVRIQWVYLMSKENRWKVKDPKSIEKKIVVDFSACCITEPMLLEEVFHEKTRL